jgi:hypothetical protein
MQLDTAGMNCISEIISVTNLAIRDRGLLNPLNKLVRV